MLKCQGGCQRMVNEYYLMPDGRIFCYDCWRYGKEEETRLHRNVGVEERKFRERQKNAERQLEELDLAIKREESRSEWRNYEEGYGAKPSNYAYVEQLKEKRRTLYLQIQEASSPISIYLSAKRKGPLYYTNAKFISAADHALRQKQLMERMEYERKENMRLYDIALQFECGRVPYSDDIRQILQKNIYTFTNPAVILMLAENVRNDFEFTIMIKKYGKFKGVYDNLLVNKNLVSCPYQIKELALANKGDTLFLVKFLSNKLLASKCIDIHTILPRDVTTLKQLLDNDLIPATMVNWADEYVFEAENKTRILNGMIWTQRDLAYAEKHYYESKKYNFIKQLAQKSSNQSILSYLCTTISRSKELKPQEKNDLYWCLLKNVHLAKENYILSCLIDSLTDKTQLERIENYCTDDFLFRKWLDKMQELGYLSQSQRKRKVNKRYPRSSDNDSGCLWFIIIICFLVFIGSQIWG